MRINTKDQLFDHSCQIKDMKLAGFNPTTLRYHCTVCGGQFFLKLDKQKWEEAFGDNPSFRLTKKILTVLEGDVILDDDEIQEAAKEAMETPDPKKFSWIPDDDEDEDEKK